MMSAQRIYLASRSPRRREILTQIGVPFDTLLFRSGDRADPEVDETPLAGEAPDEYVQRVALAKARHGVSLATYRNLPPQPVLSADTTVVLGREILGKPRDEADAAAMLERLSGSTHQVLTAVVVAGKSHVAQALSVSTVNFRSLSPEDIRRYVASGEPMDKAGAYGIQGRAALFVAHMAGSYTGIMGLPVFETGQLLERFGFVL